MSKLLLPEVTLVMIETREHTLARMAIEDCLKVADFADVLVITDRPLEFSPLTQLGVTPRFHVVEDFPDKLGWCRSSWYDVPPLLRTSHALQIQWDSWICDTDMWDDEFLDYDFIGAPWWYKDGKNVGNSGFSLVTTRLKRYLGDRPHDFPCDTSAEDDLMCRKYRPRLEEAGLQWAPQWLAHNFAFECARPAKQSRHFGFHAMFNWPYVLDHDRLLERLRIATTSEYISNSYIMKAFCETHPAIIKELVAESHPELTV